MSKNGLSSQTPEEYFLQYEPLPDVTALVKAGFGLISPFFGGLDVGSIAMNLYDAAKSYNDYLLQSKIQAFVTGCHDISAENVQSFMRKFRNQKDIQRIGLNTLMLLDKADTFEKAELIAKAFTLLINDQYSLEFYFRICHMINRAHYLDLTYLKHFNSDDTIITSINSYSIPECTLSELFVCGFLSDMGFSGGGVDTDRDCGTRYMLNEFGIALKNLQTNK